MDAAEQLLSSNPDSAYVILNAIDSRELSSSRLKARRALLNAMAIDKMGIDTTNYEIIRPAADYFLKNGSPDEKLLTYYYLGRIYQNSDDYESALGTFIRGKELMPLINDSLVMGQLLMAESSILSKLPDYDKMLVNNIMAAELFKGIGRPDFEVQSRATALNLCVYTNDSVRGDSIYHLIASLVDVHPEFAGIATPYVLSYIITFGKAEQIAKAIEDAQNLDRMNDWTIKDIALGYHALGDDIRAKRWFDSIPEDGAVGKQPLYWSLKSHILEGLNDYKGALEAHNTLLDLVEENYEATSKQDIYFAQKRYETEIDNLNEIRKRERFMWVSVVAALVLLFIVAAVLRSYRANRKVMSRQGKEIEALREKHARAMEENEKLQSETESLQSAKETYLSKLERERQEKAQLQMAIMLIDQAHQRLLAEKEAARIAKERAEAELAKEHEELESYRCDKEAAERELAKEREEVEAYRMDKERAESELASLIQDKEQLEREHNAQSISMEKMQTQINDMEAQTAQLTLLLNKKEDMDPKVEKVLRDRLWLLHGMLATHISKNDKLAAKFIEERDRVINDREGFMNATRLAFQASHPRFIRFLEEKGLSVDEINYACLYAIGMNGKEVGNYLKKGRHYHVSSDIRSKLGLPENSTNLSIYVRNLLSLDQGNSDRD